MCYIGWLHLLILEKWTYVGYVLLHSAAHSPLVTRTVCSKGAPYVGYMGPYILVGPSTVSAQMGVVGPWPSWLSGPASSWASCPLVGRVRSWCIWLCSQVDLEVGGYRAKGAQDWCQFAGGR